MSIEPSGGAAMLLELVAARALWLIKQDAAPAATSAAAHALLEGHDSEPLRELAGAPIDTNVFELGELIDASLVSLGVPTSGMTEDDALVLVAHSYAQQVIDGRIRVRDFTAWAHSVMGHDGPSLTRDVVELDDIYDAFDGGMGEEPNPTKTLEQFLDASRGAVQKWTKVPKP